MSEFLLNEEDETHVIKRRESAKYFQDRFTNHHHDFEIQKEIGKWIFVRNLQFSLKKE